MLDPYKVIVFVASVLLIKLSSTYIFDKNSTELGTYQGIIGFIVGVITSFYSCIMLLLD